MHSQNGTPVPFRNQVQTAWLGLGANLPGPAGPPETTLAAAAAALGELGTVQAASHLWRSAPVGPVQDQPPFTNAALRLETILDPHALLRALQAIELRFGRTRGGPQNLAKGPRTLDLDILLIEHASNSILLEDSSLTLPHPEMHRRRFVLAPLDELAPALRHPLLGLTVGELLRALPPDQSVQRLPGNALGPCTLVKTLGHT